MKIVSYAVALATLAIAHTANAQEATPVAAQDCELHIWPTEEYVGLNSGLLSGFGIVGVLADQAAHKDRVMTVKDLMREYLGPEVQAEELRKADVAGALGLSGYRIVVEAPLPSTGDVKENPALKESAKAMRAKVKSGLRLSDSTALCYAELIGNVIFYHKAMMYGSNLFSGWTFRDFGRVSGAAPRVVNGSVKNPLEHFPPKTPENVDVAKAEIRDAYAKDFLEYVQKKVRGVTARPAAR